MGTHTAHVCTTKKDLLIYTTLIRLQDLYQTPLWTRNVLPNVGGNRSSGRKPPQRSGDYPHRKDTQLSIPGTEHMTFLLYKCILLIYLSAPGTGVHHQISWPLENTHYCSTRAEIYSRRILKLKRFFQWCCNGVCIFAGMQWKIPLLGAKMNSIQI